MLTIRNGNIADAAELSQLAERAFRDAFGDQNSVADMSLHAERSYSPEHQSRELADANITTLIATDSSGALIAYAQLRGEMPPPCVTGLEPLELWRFYVDRSYHGRGIAQALMVAVCERARTRGAGTLWLGVWENNPRARAFYLKEGFEDVGSHVFTLGADAQTDRILVRSLVN